MKRLTLKRNSDGSVSQPTDLQWADVLDKLTDYEDQEESGLLLRLPAKPGDTVMAYLDSPSLDLTECVVSQILYDKDFKEPLFTAVSYEHAEYNTFWQSDFGKEIFTLEQYWSMLDPGKATPAKKKGRQRK